ncbi:glycosyltransferase family 2 protein [Spongiivirga sp. MCCC 1A20706]|uniref:glycosyltransferase family 2 protein n=1 Tax=Spongiivirga sp. MCCC 1A20706 TaxID=3160963 RepID=UPI0039772811
MDFEFTIIIPIYNEEANLDRLEKELLNYLPIAIKKTCVLFVNDGSTDNSLLKIKSICEHKAFSFISFTENCGLSTAIKAGFDHTKTPLTGYMDGDLQTTPYDFNLLLKHAHNYQLVTGARNKRNDAFIKKASSTIANKIRRLFTKDGMDDTGCPLKVIHSNYAKKIPMFRGIHRFLPAMILLQNGKIKQIPIRHFPRMAGTSKFGIINRVFSSFADCFAYLWMKRKYIDYTIESKKELH